MTTLAQLKLRPHGQKSGNPKTQPKTWLEGLKFSAEGASSRGSGKGRRTDDATSILKVDRGKLGDTRWTMFAIADDLAESKVFMGVCRPRYEK